ncbi:MAG TPA: hypothetical protein VFT27_11605 [Actinomycetota bacterium]|nr:hypothetical protein [Actinomycetota bacterium]
MTGPRVAYADVEPNGLAEMVGGLIEANLVRDPRRGRLLRRAVIDLVAIDADVAVSLAVGREDVRVANGLADGRADVRVTTDSLSLVELAGAPLRFGFPDVFRLEGRLVVRKILDRRIQIEGLVRHPLRVSRITRLLSVT